MTKLDLVREISYSTETSQETVMKIINTFMETVKSEVAGGRSVSLRGFGMFDSVVRKPKPARDIRRGVTVELPRRTVPTFRPYDDFKNMVDPGNAGYKK